MNRQKVYQLLSQYLKNKNLLKHSLAAEAAMKAICKKLNPDADQTEIEKWGITGLLHDVDYEIAMETHQLGKHGLLIFEHENGIPEDIMYAIKAHNPANGTKPKSKLDFGIYCSDQLTGLMVAATLVLPDKKLSSLTVDSVLKRMKEKSFAKGAMREPILQCEEKLGIPLPDFVTVVLKAMQGIHEEMGL